MELRAIYHRCKAHLRPLLFLLLAFFAGCLAAGLFFNRERFVGTGELDSRYDSEYRAAAEIIGQLETELERERRINSQLREHNARARELTEGLASASERNVRNLQDAVSLIGEVRKKLKVLEGFYADSGTGDGGD